jgi:hypothetical protein
MATINEDIVRSAEWIAQALRSSGYRADFTPQSLWEIERFFNDNSSEGAATANGHLSQSLGQRIFALGAYMGEVARRALGGDWVGDDGNPETEISVELRLPGGVCCWPIQRAMKRFKNGAEDSTAAWGMGIGLHVGPPPRHPPAGLLSRLFG